MSRYFTSPPPVYARNWANGQNLVESTKIERQQIVASKKAQRKEKKEKKKETKLRNEISLKLQIIHSKKVSNECEQLEKSCVTEELEQHQQIGYLSDGSQNSKKRKREKSPVVVSNVKATPVAGNPLRIRFVFNNAKEAETVPQEDRVCSTSGAELRSESKVVPDAIATSVSRVKTQELNENLPATCENDKAAIPTETKKSKKHKLSKESRYNSLFDDWVPPSMSIPLLEDDNDDWLFSSRRQEKSITTAATNNYKDTNMNLQTSRDSSCPKAQFLPEVGIFALPYAIPF